jgi:hypothetical protein
MGIKGATAVLYCPCCGELKEIIIKEYDEPRLTGDEKLKARRFALICPDCKSKLYEYLDNLICPKCKIGIFKQIGIGTT